jgi:hypothetical protein
MTIDQIRCEYATPATRRRPNKFAHSTHIIQIRCEYATPATRRRPNKFAHSTHIVQIRCEYATPATRRRPNKFAHSVEHATDNIDQARKRDTGFGRDKNRQSTSYPTDITSAYWGQGLGCPHGRRTPGAAGEALSGPKTQAREDLLRGE